MSVTENIDHYLWPSRPRWQSGHIEPYYEEKEAEETAEEQKPEEKKKKSYRFWNTQYKSYKIPEAWTEDLEYEFRKRKWTINGKRLMRYMFEHYLDRLLEDVDPRAMQGWLAFPEDLAALAVSYGEPGIRLYEKIRWGALDIRKDNYLDQEHPDGYRLFIDRTNGPNAVPQEFPREIDEEQFPNEYRLPFPA
jgi:hypothetical protein